MWYTLKDEQTIATPSLVVFPLHIRENVQQLLTYVKSPAHLCPHVKTHKSADILHIFLDAGIRNFKCATLTELRMVASISENVFGLLAIQPVGPQVGKLIELAQEFPNCSLATIVDNERTLQQLSNAAQRGNITLDIFVDIDSGMQRSGIVCGDEAFNLYQEVANHPCLRQGGLHVYDGHLHHREIDDRRRMVEAAIAPVVEFRRRLVDAGCSVDKLLAGGTPSFPIHAAHDDRVCCPGTPALWDAGYEESFPDLRFQPAAVLLTRVVSKISADLYCVDLGYKSIASEMPPPRARFLNANVVEECGHSEEHLVIRIEQEHPLEVGDLLYAQPRHICPTVARHPWMFAVQDGLVVGEWPVTARDHFFRAG